MKTTIKIKRFIKSIIPYEAFLKIKKAVFFGRKRYCPICESQLRLFQPFGMPTRLSARCPVCGSLERHRLVWIFFQEYTDLFNGKPKSLLHVAPERCIERRFRKIDNLDCITVDIVDGRAMIQVDITNIYFPDNSFDVIYCSHVLEHIQDDRQALAELYRILRPKGWAVIQVPITSAATIEDPSVTDPGEREKMFGQADHVRRYGPDYIGRITEVGFRLCCWNALQIADRAACVQMGIMKDDKVFYCLKDNFFS